MSRVHCLDCAAEVVVDPRGLCPSGHHLGTSGARVAEAIGSATPHPDEPEPWVGRIEPEEVAEVATPAPRTPVPQTAPGLAPAAPPPIDTQDLFAELGALGDLGGDLDGLATGPSTDGAPTHAASPNGSSPNGASPNGASPYAASPNGTSSYGASPNGAPSNGASSPAARPLDGPVDASPWTSEVDAASWGSNLDAEATHGSLDTGPHRAPAADEPTAAHDGVAPSGGPEDAAPVRFDEEPEGWGASLDELVASASGAPAPWEAPAPQQAPPPQQATDPQQPGEAQQAPAAQQAPTPPPAAAVQQAPAAQQAPAPPPAPRPAVAPAPSPSTVDSAPAGGNEALDALSEISALEAAVQSLTDASNAPSAPRHLDSPHLDAPQHPPAPAPAPLAAPASAGLDDHELRRAAFADVASLGAQPATAPNAGVGDGAPEPSAPPAPPVEQLQAAGAEGRPPVGIDTMNFTAKGGRPRRSDQPRRRLFGR